MHVITISLQLLDFDLGAGALVLLFQDIIALSAGTQNQLVYCPKFHNLMFIAPHFAILSSLIVTTF